MSNDLLRWAVAEALTPIFKEAWHAADSEEEIDHSRVTYGLDAVLAELNLEVAQ